MNIPEKNTVWGNPCDHVMLEPMMLQPENHRYHPIGGMPEYGREPVVMFTAGARRNESYAAGTHDGIRDGSYSGKLHMEGNQLGYCTKAAWLAAGNKKFWKEDE